MVNRAIEVATGAPDPTVRRRLPAPVLVAISAGLVLVAALILIVIVRGGRH
jgi:hypothetical protein